MLYNPGAGIVAKWIKLILTSALYTSTSFMSRLRHFQSSSLLMVWEKEKTAHVSGPLSPMQETQMKLLTLAWPTLDHCCYRGGEPANGRSLSIPFQQLQVTKSF